MAHFHSTGLFPKSLMLKRVKKKLSGSHEVIICMAGISVFALFVNKGSPFFILAIAGLSTAGYIIYFTIRKNNSISSVFGFSKFSVKGLLYIFIGILAGVLFGMLYNIKTGSQILPQRFTVFAVIGALIGSTEEVIFRGYIQGQLRKAGVIFTIIIPALCHTVYKALLFTGPSLVVQVDMMQLIEYTFIAGVILSILRKISKDVLVPVGAHACFDIIVYGGALSSPWWVW